MARFVYAAFVCAVALGTFHSAAEPEPITVRRVPNGGLQPEVVRDDQGTLHMLYFAGAPGNGDLFYVRSTDDGAIFSAPVRVNSQDGSAIATGTIRGGQLTLGRDGRIHVVWNGSGKAFPKGPADPRTGQAGSALLYTRSNQSGTAFEPQRSVMQRSLTLDGGGSVAADRAGNVYVAWHGNSAAAGNDGEGNRRLFVARSTDDGRTFAPESPAWTEQTGACACCGVRMFASKNGGLFLLYRSAAENINRDVYMLRSDDRGRTFRGARVHEWDIEACPMTSMSFVEGSSDVFASWESDGQVYFGTVDKDRPAVAKPVAPAGDAKPRKHPRLAAGADHLLMVWTEGTAFNRGGSIGWQLFDRAQQPVGAISHRTGLPASSFATAVARPGGFTIFY